MKIRLCSAGRDALIDLELDRVADLAFDTHVGDQTVSGVEVGAGLARVVRVAVRVGVVRLEEIEGVVFDRGSLWVVISVFLGRLGWLNDADWSSLAAFATFQASKFACRCWW